MKNIAIAFISLLIIASVSCKQGKEEQKFKLINPKLVEAELLSINQTASYTYIELKEGKDKYWGAITHREDLLVGQLYYFDDFIEMQEFPSKELDKTFDRIYFINKISNKPYAAEEDQHQHQENAQGSTHSDDMKVENIDKAEGGFTIVEIFEKKAELEGKKVKISGQVVKYTPGVMGKNWVHIQDGSGVEQVADLTFTTDEELQIGAIVVIEGTLNLNRDFGHGYTYDILVEEARVLDKKMVKEI